MGKLDKISQSEHWEGRCIGLEQVPRMALFQVKRGNVQVVNSLFQGPWWQMSVPMFLKPGMFIFTNTDKINIYNILTLRNFTVSHR
jgi:hypothetical protein